MTAVPPAVQGRVTAGRVALALNFMPFTGGFFLMLLLQDLHLKVSASVPPLGFWTCFWLIAWTMGVVAALLLPAVGALMRIADSAQEIERAVRSQPTPHNANIVFSDWSVRS